MPKEVIILIIGREPLEMLVASQHLENAGHLIAGMVHTRADAIEMLRTRRPEIAIFTTALPLADISPFDLATEIVDSYGASIILITGFATEALSDWMEIAAVLNKPLDGVALTELVQSFF